MKRITLVRAAPVADDSPVGTLKPLTLPERRMKMLEAVHEDHSEQRITRPHLSYSQLAMVLRCGFQYRFRYILGLKERPKVSLSIGKGGHAALEWNTRHKLRTGSDQPAAAIVQKASDMMDHYLSELPPSEIEKDVEPGALKDRQLAATQVYALRDAPKIEPIGAEVEYDLDVNPYVPDWLRDKLTDPIRPVNMKLDLMSKDPDNMIQAHDQGIRVAITDYKFVTRKKTQAEVNMSPQLTTYATAVKDLTGKFVTKLGFQMMHPGSMAKNAKPTDGPDSVALLREPEQMTPDALARRMTRVATQFAQAERMIREEIFNPVDDPITCSWCGYRDRCQASLVDDFEAAKIREVTTPR